MDWVGRRPAGIVMRFDPADAQVLRGLVTGVWELVGGRLTGREPGGPGAPPGETSNARNAGKTSQAGNLSDAGGALDDRHDPHDPLEELVGIGGPTAPPRDPALARLLPDGYTDDEEAAAEFRRLTETSLRRHKSETAQRVLDSLPAEGGRICLDEETTRAWMSALNDIRLVIGTRLDVTEEMDMPEPSDPRAPGYELYRWLTLLQELLVEATIGGFPLD